MILTNYVARHLREILGKSMNWSWMVVELLKISICLLGIHSFSLLEVSLHLNGLKVNDFYLYEVQKPSIKCILYFHLPLNFQRIFQLDINYIPFTRHPLISFHSASTNLVNYLVATIKSYLKAIRLFNLASKDNLASSSNF